MKIIAIDGPSGVGKGSIANLLAEKLNFERLDTGAVYRCVTLLCIENNITLKEEDKIIYIANNLNLEIKDNEFFLNNRNVSKRIRAKDVSDMVTEVSSIVEVRNILSSFFKNFVKDKNIVVDGRDTTTALFKDAYLKFYLDANMDTRVKRRYNQSIANNIDITFDEVIDNIGKRDYNDTHKKVGKLIKSDDSIYIDTSYLSEEQVIKEMLKFIGSDNVNLKDLYIKYFEDLGHRQIPSAPVVPENDPSVLFNTAGMQPLIPYLMGEVHPYGTRLVDYQKCIRTNDLDNIGDTYHHTFFEMLGNWSLGDYFKEESITYSFNFLTKVLNIPVERLAVSVFKGNEKIEKDIETKKIWLSLGISENRIQELSDNFWIAGDTGPCGPDTEIFYFRSNDEIPENFDSEDERWVEIWNNVFMQYNKDKDGNYNELPKKNVDTGMGVERVVSILEGVDDNYLSSIWKSTIFLIENISNKKYVGNEVSMRIIADHIRTSVFIIADPSGIKPSNTDQGYILRRLIRRAIRHAKNLDIDISSNWEEQIALNIIEEYKKYYNELEENKDIVIEVLKNEKIKFNRTLEKGLKEFVNIVNRLESNKLEKDDAFRLYDTYGFPIELTVELSKERNIEVDVEGFKEKFKAHQELSRANSQAKFKGGLASTGEIETKYHTATHLLNAALKKVINKDVHQKGSNITSERMRFDFSCDHKLTDEEKKQTEELVNKWIDEDLVVTKEEMAKEEALKSGAECMFIEKYPDIVTVYSIGDVSKELCGGPHVKSTKCLGHFKIIKEEASSSGVRRIKAILEFDKPA